MFDNVTDKIWQSKFILFVAFVPDFTSCA